MLTPILQIWTPDNGDAYALVQDLAAMADDIETAILNPPTIRLTSVADASYESTAHALQIGPTSATNMLMDPNEVMARNNGAPTTLYLNRSGGDVTLGASTAVVSLPGRLDSPALPWAMAAGAVTMPSADGGSTSSLSVTFPAGRFSVAPIVTTSSGSANPGFRAMGVTDRTATGMTLWFGNTGSISLTLPANWMAVQMKPSAAAG